MPRSEPACAPQPEVERVPGTPALILPPAAAVALRRTSLAALRARLKRRSSLDVGFLVKRRAKSAQSLLRRR